MRISHLIPPTKSQLLPPFLHDAVKLFPPTAECRSAASTPSSVEILRLRHLHRHRRRVLYLGLTSPSPERRLPPWPPPPCASMTDAAASSAASVGTPPPSSSPPASRRRPLHDALPPSPSPSPEHRHPVHRRALAAAATGHRPPRRHLPRLCLGVNHSFSLFPATAILFFGRRRFFFFFSMLVVSVRRR